MSPKSWAYLSLFFLLTAFILGPFALINGDDPTYFRAWIGAALLTAVTFWQAKKSQEK